MSEPEEWHELDQASVRNGLRAIIRRDMPDEYGDQVKALGQLMSIVREEVAAALTLNLHLFVRYHAKDSVADARALVEQLERDLSSLGLALAYPETAAPLRLTVAATPPRSESESWLQIEPLQSGSRSGVQRLTNPPPPLKLVPEPSRQSGRFRDNSP